MKKNIVTKNISISLDDMLYSTISLKEFRKRFDTLPDDASIGVSIDHGYYGEPDDVRDVCFDVSFNRLETNEEYAKRQRRNLSAKISREKRKQKNGS